MYELRSYQKKAVKKLIWSQKLSGADLCVLPTGAGKSLVIAELARKTNENILIIQPTKEILEQNINKMSTFVDKSEIGVYSASMGRKDIGLYTFATIQSIYKKPEEFEHFGYVIIDECHLVNPKKPNSMFMTFLKGIGSPKVVGLTATPYRLDVTYENLGEGVFIAHTATKLINRTKGHFWKRMMYNVNIGELVDAGYLTALKYIDRTILGHDEIPVIKSKSDFDLNKFTEKLSSELDKLLEAVFFAEELCNHVLVFCPTVALAERLQLLVDGSEVVTSKTNKKTRERVVGEFRQGKIKTVFNVGVFTTGFDFPELDGIVLLRPTKSIGLYYQMLGRGVRSAEGKKNCKVIDLTGTVKFLGRIETIKLIRRKMWELESETRENWHNLPLYSFTVDPKQQKDFKLS